MATPKYEYITHRQMDGYYAEVCRGMASAQYRPDVIIALSRGGLDFGVKLSNWFEDVELVPLVWQTRDGSRTDIARLFDVLTRYKGGTVLIVDDLLDSGATFEKLDEAINKSVDKFQENVIIDYAVAIENTEADFEVNWRGRTIQRSEHPQWFVFPWEHWWSK